MDRLAETLAEVRARIGRNRAGRRLNEQNTKATLIDPVLRALGWDLEDVDEVVREYKEKRRDKPVDFALLLMGKPRLIVEAKALTEDLDDRRWANQAMGYAAVAGADWVALTNGDEWRIYNSHVAVSVDEKLFRRFRVSAGDGEAERTLPLLGRGRMAENAIEVLWKAEFVDRQVGAALEDMFGAGNDADVAKLLRRRLPGLSPSDLKASLRRARVEVSFPPVEADAAPRADDGGAAGGRSASRTAPRGAKRGKGERPRLTLAKGSGGRRAFVGVSMADLVRAGLVAPPLELRKAYRGVEVRATVEADGTVMFDGGRAETISRAADLARTKVLKAQGATGKVTVNTNGWTWWTFAGPDGKRRTLDGVRREYLGSLGRVRGEGPSSGERT